MFTAVREMRFAMPRALAAGAVRTAIQAAMTRIAPGVGTGAVAPRALAWIRGWHVPLGLKAAVLLAACSMAVFAIAAGEAFVARREPEAATLVDQPKAIPLPPGYINDPLPLPAGAAARIGPTKLAHGGAVSAVACQPGGGLAASAGSGIVKLWDVATGTLVRELPGHAHYFQTLAFSADGSLLASGGDDRIIRVWDVKTGRPTLVIPASRSGGSGPIMPFPIALTPDGKAVAGGCPNGLIILWDVDTGRERARLDSRDAPQAGQNDAFARMIDTLAISPDGKWLAAASRSSGVQVWNLGQGRLVQTIPNRSAWFQLAFSPDSRTLAWYGRSPQAGVDSAGIQLWDVVGGQLRARISAARQGYLAFSPDGRRLVSTGWDRKISLWDLPPITIGNLVSLTLDSPSTRHRPACHCPCLDCNLHLNHCRIPTLALK